ncbi:MAG TPA: glycosyltransferase [Gammaproteobacteria bacterium]|nr:glycosyltransferase [Gammaproteobacteria bacterium]
MIARVVLVTTSFPESVLGSEAAGGFVSDFAAALSRRVEVAVVAPGADTGRARSGDVRVFRYRAPVQPLSLLRPRSPAHWPAILQTLKNGGRALEAALNHRPADHVLALWALPSGYWASRCARRNGTPYSVWALGSDIWTLGRVPLVRSILRRVLRGAAHRFADGYKLAEDVRRISDMSCHFLASARRFPVSGNPRRRRGPPYRLAYLGRWHRNKGTDLLLAALDRLPERAWARIEAVRVAGGGPLDADIRTACEALESKGRPLMLEGYLDPNEAAALFSWADFICIPSRIESIPVVFSDALQARRPVIATPVGDLPRLLNDGAAGILSKATSVAAYAAAIESAVTLPTGSLGEGLDTLRRQFEVEAIAGDFLNRIGKTPA